jgi:predicted phosphate transport protein (TIGR00153 family)
MKIVAGMATTSFSNRIMNIALDHVRRVKDCGTNLAQCVDAWVKGDIETAKEKYEQILVIEAEADDLKNSLTTQIAEVDALGLSGKIMDPTLIMKTDNLVDYSEGVGQRLLNCSWHGLPVSVIEKAVTLGEANQKTMDLVRDAFFALNENPDKTVKVCNDIDDAEREMDKIFRELQTILYSDELQDVDLRKILPFLDAMEHLEDIGDLAEQVADSLKILVIAKFGTE